ncbi:hypothetical protein HMPREF0971_03377 [Segatella oris F0302]|uniref:Lipoprotein n=1 Tax=Segatella oris F0302 TaxID=649760 RepID=D1QWI0_9BACT|nr:hypothetical protein HMPREF0971_03377 [Segatella oris F0302]
MKYILIIVMVSLSVCISTACSGLGNKTKRKIIKVWIQLFVGKLS